jgi:hypothetical protein
MRVRMLNMHNMQLPVELAGNPMEQVSKAAKPKMGSIWTGTTADWMTARLPEFLWHLMIACTPAATDSGSAYDCENLQLANYLIAKCFPGLRYMQSTTGRGD